MTAPEMTEEAKVSALARRLIWWKPPADALADPHRLLAQVMKLGTWNDILEAKRYWPRSAFCDALRHAPAGVFDARSWSYWHHMLDLLPVPPLPTRTFPET